MSVKDLSRPKIRVLQLIDTFNVGGAEKIVLSLATKTDRERFEIVPCALFRSGPLEEEMKAAGIAYRVLGLPRRSILTGPLFLADLMRMVLALTKTIRELSIDIVHTHLTNSTLVGVLATRQKYSPPLCATVHSIIFHTQRGQLSPRAWLKRVGVKSAFSRIKRIIAVSEEVSRAIQLYAGIRGDHITTIPNGVDPDLFYSHKDLIQLRGRLNLPTDRSVLVSVGRLTRPKGYPHLLAALSLIPSQERPLTLIIGDGPDRNGLESKITTLKLENDVRLLGTRKDVPALLAAADVFVLASLWEGLPLALLEAMASGLPSVVTAVGENPKVIEDGKAGLVVPPGDEAGLAQVLRHLLREPSQRKQMGQTARDRFERHFSLQRCIAAHEVLYENLVAQHSECSLFVNSQGAAYKSH
jgi:glycosyltransferase involved in cell wall biosynthesis